MADRSVKGRITGWTWWLGLGLLLIVLIVFAQSRASRPLDLWHTETLSAEFTVSRVDDIRNFDDYRQLEDALFLELDEKVYAKTEVGPEFALVRYSPGSAADPHGRTPNWNRSFEWPAENPLGGVLLLHGMSDGPYTLRTLAKALNERGYWVLGLRLPGHGTAPSGLTTVTWPDMAAAVRLAAAHIASRIDGKPIHIVGYSTGAPLALNFTLDAYEDEATPVPASLVLISPAIGIHPAAALAGLKTNLSAVPGLGDLAWVQIAPEFDPYKYNSFATNAGSLVHGLSRSVARRIRERARTDPDNVLPPVVVFKSTVDATVSNDALIDRLLRRLAANRHELVLFDINRFAVISKLMISDPGSFTDRLRADETLPFAITFVTNETPQSTMVVARHKPPFSAEATEGAALNLSWPTGVISLSHVALPFAPDDPLYGQRPPDNDDVLFLGEMAIRGERGLLPFPADWLLRLRYNPFYDYLEQRALDWVEDSNTKATIASTAGED